MQRVMIVGSAGSGKSTLARTLGSQLDLPVIHLDTYYWRPGWVEPLPDEWREQVRALVQSDAWIIDGNYSATMDLRFEKTDTVIFLDTWRMICLARTLKRSLLNHGKTRPDSAPGCPERFNTAFLKWVWTYPVERRPAMLERLASLPSHIRVVRLRNNQEIHEFLKEIAR